MALDLESRLRVFFASAPRTAWPIQTLEISHQAFRTWHLWREPYAGETTTEAGRVVNMVPCNFGIKLAGTPGHLDQLFEITLDTTDIEDKFRESMDAVPIATQQKVFVTYREYLSDDLSGPLAVAKLQLETISYQIGAATLSAASPRLNVTRTGETYNPRDIPMLRGFS